MIFLQDDIIRLRAVEPEDSCVIWEIENDTAQWLDNCMSAPLSAAILSDYALSYDANPFRAGQIRLIIENKSSNDIIGIADLFEISAIHRTAFIGIYIRPKYRKKGIGQRTLKNLAIYAYSVLNLVQLGAKIVIDNKESINLFIKCRFIQTGILPNWIQTGAERKDLLFFTKNLLT